MAEKRKINLDSFLESNPVFRLEEYAEAQGRPQDLQAIRNQIKYHVRRGRVKRVAAGVYGAAPFGQDPKTFWPDAVLVVPSRLQEWEGRRAES